VLLSVVESLSLQSGRDNVNATLDKFDRLWRAAYRAPFLDGEVEGGVIDLESSNRIEVSFIHPTDSDQVLTASVAVNLTAGLIIERLIEFQFIVKAQWGGSYYTKRP
jgi:hypothetical protein